MASMRKSGVCELNFKFQTYFFTVCIYLFILFYNVIYLLLSYSLHVLLIPLRNVKTKLQYKRTTLIAKNMLRF